MPRHAPIRSIPTLADISLFLSSDGITHKDQMHRPEAPIRWRRTKDHEAVRFEPGVDPDYQTLARYVLAQAVCDARLTSTPMALLAKRARRWLRADSPDLRFWCVRAGIQPTNLRAWAAAQFPKATDPQPDPARLKAIVRTKRRVDPGVWDRKRYDLDPLRNPLTNRGRPWKEWPEGMTRKDLLGETRGRKRKYPASQHGNAKKTFYLMAHHRRRYNRTEPLPGDPHGE